MGIKRGTTLAAVAVAVVFTATACGGSDPAGDAAKPAGAVAAPSQAPSSGSPGSSGDGYGSDASAAGAAEAGPTGQLAVTQDEKLGSVLTDSAGFTLYRFDKDTAKPSKSSCDGDCAKTWPVVAAGDATAAAGMDPALLGEVVRTDGSKQLTVAGWPVYRFSKDTKAGDTNGQGVGGTWFAAAPDGKKAAKAAPPAAGAGQPSGALTVAKDPKLGDHIVDGNGMTVYRFKPDTAWPMVSKCEGDCVAKWPVVPPVDQANTKGIVQKNYLVLDRPDGKKQQTVDCWPVYTFTGDKKPGDINGQGVGGTWYPVAPNGKLITAQ
ncbi:SCO0930 family lipoprotein [Streptomyces sp. TBY4]|uniref:SCO0930 family lipoprotein n=1 Tax=Streptomyces sp. TBY4 TaxID=2962030 RepID=UPI0020B7C568|nr:SCO0930 family lipoprotein [Streptomyces sp. TBY4]MCP3759914.1 SCO0930 family lipoprotein [Streptomyces sp. TBY4]